MKTHLSFWQDWTSLPFVKENNWTDFTLIHLHAEISPYKDSWEIGIGLFGFHVELTVYKDSNDDTEAESFLQEADSRRAEERTEAAVCPSSSTSDECLSGGQAQPKASEIFSNIFNQGITHTA